MATQEFQTIRLKNDFYQDGFKKMLLTTATILAAGVVLIIVSVYLFLQKPEPVIFYTDNEWRILPDVPLDQPYVKTSDLIQWVSNVLPAAFTLDFINYNNQLKAVMQYFTDNGQKRFIDQLNLYISYNFVQNSKLFANGSAAGAPFILNQGLLSGKYSWWIQMPINVTFTSIERVTYQSFIVQVLVQRMSTLENLTGLTIENIIVSVKGGVTPIKPNG